MFSIILRFWKLNLMQIFEYRMSFWAEILGMMISDLITIIIWIFFFHKLGKIGGMDIQEYIILYSILLFNFSYVHVLFGGYWDIAENIMNGGLDSYLLLPRNELFLMLISKLRINAL